jgi:hypothetical protein
MRGVRREEVAATHAEFLLAGGSALLRRNRAVVRSRAATRVQPRIEAAEQRVAGEAARVSRGTDSSGR